MTHLSPAVSVDNAPPTPTAPLINVGSPDYRELVRDWNARESVAVKALEWIIKRCQVDPMNNGGILTIADIEHYATAGGAAYRAQDADDDASECAGSEVAK